jgi:3-hydroxyisobutyrate dehydrogenase-like beta-hydroxyacid dehydrogenase
MVGGARDIFERNRELLAVFGERVYHLGPAGSGSRAKLAGNLVLGLNRAVLAEGLVFAERLGLDLPVFLDVLKNSPAYSAAMDAKGQRMLDGDFAPVSRVRQHLKDVELILEYARRCGQELPLSAVHHDLLARAVAAGDGELDNAAVIRELRRLAIRGSRSSSRTGKRPGASGSRRST